MSDNQTERNPGRFAEIGVVQSHLNERVLGNKLYVLVEAPQDASDAAKDNLYHRVIFVHFFILLGEVFEHDSDCCNHCDDERSEGDRANVIK